MKGRHQSEGRDKPMLVPFSAAWRRSPREPLDWTNDFRLLAFGPVIVAVVIIVGVLNLLHGAVVTGAAQVSLGLLLAVLGLCWLRRPVGRG